MLFEVLLAAVAIVGVGAAVIALDGSRDVFHPLVFIGPMLAFLYGWMPWRLQAGGGLDQYLDPDQLLFVQRLFFLGVLAFVVACLAAGLRTPTTQPAGSLSTDVAGSSEWQRPSPEAACRLLAAGAITGSLGLICWSITIINVGGFVNAYSSSYSGGWDDSGYVRDGSLLLLTGILLAVTALSAGASRLWGSLVLVVYSLPWLSQAILMARRGPTFAYALIVLMGWYFNRKKRPPILAVAVFAGCLGWLVLFLVTNRGSIYLGSSFDVQTDVGSVVEKPDTGNEYIYGSGTVLATERRNHYFWMRRYLSQVLVRPIPSAIWPTKYEDFGVPELLHNAGTGEGFGDALGWVGATGSAPGIVADLWVELWWLAVPAMALLGYGYGWVWRRAVLRGGVWTSQYVILSALSIYLVMQTMEAVIFRTLLLSLPCWIAWAWAVRAPTNPPRSSGGRAPSTRPGIRSSSSFAHRHDGKLRRFEHA